MKKGSKQTKEARKKQSKIMKEGYKSKRIKISGCAKMSQEGLLSGKNHPMYGKKKFKDKW